MEKGDILKFESTICRLYSYAVSNQEIIAKKVNRWRKILFFEIPDKWALLAFEQEEKVKKSKSSAIPDDV